MRILLFIVFVFSATNAYSKVARYQDNGTSQLPLNELCEQAAAVGTWNESLFTPGTPSREARVLCQSIESQYSLICMRKVNTANYAIYTEPHDHHYKIRRALTGFEIQACLGIQSRPGVNCVGGKVGEGDGLGSHNPDYSAIIRSCIGEQR
jgi:hypothetical protein